MDPLNTAQAHALRKAMREARRALDQAHAGYHHAFAVATDVNAEAGVDGAFGLVQQGRAYAAALMRYTEATMAWLVFVDNRQPAKKADNG